MRRIMFASTAVVVCAVSSSLADSPAQGPGKGLGRALSQVGKGNPAGGGMNKVGKDLSRVGAGRANGLNRAAALKPLGKLPKEGKLAGRAGSEVPQHQKQLTLAQRQRDHKLDQAQKLRELAERNGNPELAANADRMEAQALQHYEERAAHLEKFGVVEPELGPVENPAEGELALEPPVIDSPEAPIVDDAPVAAEKAGGIRSAARPWWKPKWLTK